VPLKDVNAGALSILVQDIKNLVTGCPIRTFELIDEENTNGKAYLPVIVK
jgi:hypothetical protein